MLAPSGAAAAVEGAGTGW
uniref:Uncharacterized protein n=1 Tax=Arundo donax TaxID=35708 RepID=A0A0A9EK34_ARUDO